MLLCLPCIAPSAARKKAEGPSFPPRDEPAKARAWGEGIEKQLLEEGYIHLGFLTIKKKQSKVTQDKLREIVSKRLPPSAAIWP